MQLRAKGVERDIVERALATLDDDSQLKRLTERLQRKMRTTKAANDYELRGKLLRYAMSLGYDYELAKELTDKIVE